MSLQHAHSGQVVRLAPWSPAPIDSRTAAVIKAKQLEVVRIVLPAGKAFAEHHVPGEITVLCLEGRILFRTAAAEQVMAPGDFIHLQGGTPHALEALEDASALLTICLLAGA